MKTNAYHQKSVNGIEILTTMRIQSENTSEFSYSEPNPLLNFTKMLSNKL